MKKPNPLTRKSPWVLPIILSGLLMVSFTHLSWAQDNNSQDEDDRRIRRLGDTVAEQEEFSLEFPTDLTANEPVETPPEVTLPDPQQNEELQNLLIDLAYSPGDQQITSRIDEILDDVVVQADTALTDGDLVLAEQLLAVLSTLQPERESVARISQAIEQRRTLNELLTAGQTALQENRLQAPEEDNAVYYFRQVLALDEENAAAQAGLEQIQQNLIDAALASAEELDFETANTRLDEAEALELEGEAVVVARQRVEQIGEERALELQVTTAQAIDNGRFDEAESMLNELIALGGSDEEVQRLRESLEDARVYGGFTPGQTFRDDFTTASGEGPTMVVVPAGSFMMGSPEPEPDRVSNEGPQHRITFSRGFALAQTEITVGQFRRFVELTGYRTDAERQGDSTVYDEDSGRLTKGRVTWREAYAGQRADDDLPVIHVSWNDANNYAQWLAEMTGRRYRLPSEAEFEYAMRGGTQSVYWWGDGDPNTVVENLTGDGDVSRSRRRWNEAFEDYEDGYWGPAPVATFQPNPFGLYDINGNVKEWVQDCWHDTYVRAPSDGTAWINQGCDSRVIRGGDWTSTPAMSRSAFRITASTETRGARVGFRVARDL